MYRFISQWLYVAQKPSVNIFGLCMLPANCDKSIASILRLPSVCSTKCLSTHSNRFCENKNNVANSNNEDSTETQTVSKQQTAHSSDIKKLDEQNDRDNIKKTDVINVQDDAAEGKELDTSKSGKQSLLDLLGAMKVDVTSKKRLKLLKIKPSVSIPTSRPMESKFQEDSVDISSQRQTLDPELVAAASAAASTLPNRIQAESELLKQLRQHEDLTEAQKKGEANDLGVILADMKVSVKSQANRLYAQPANQIRFDDDGQGYKRDRGVTSELDGVRRKKGLFSGKKLNIFSLPTDEDKVTETVARPTLWDVDFAKQLSSLANQMPRNAFEKMIKWTEEGKLWQYPIDNEACFDEDARVPFHEHVFLEKHLEEGFPQRGPVRHFMELVVIGLSKNPYLTVQQKKEHISWFRDYFNQKQDVLKEAEVYLN
ncbi:small ribosomal subunit protein mS31-like [Entelurus aequoreus]|uniref:small ribosomal subunit protein mS31-like n=1 Tax=Entelurus aequoreus TaxID=161455 RepID=UPI002B1E4264|nr:small ribosomal subunit protein mS31-like [Entelurus aequoreus]XP_061903831.1 small ribosomal subunit protein mS31-like [Entelurus aequoreus]